MISALFELISDLIDTTVPDILNRSYEALVVDSTADARLYTQFLAYVHKNEAYQLAEAADMTEDERTGLYKLRARIEQMEFEIQKEIVCLCLLCCLV